MNTVCPICLTPGPPLEAERARASWLAHHLWEDHSGSPEDRAAWMEEWAAAYTERGLGGRRGY